jgi:hypothetical protein
MEESALRQTAAQYQAAIERMVAERKELSAKNAELSVPSECATPP